MEVDDEDENIAFLIINQMFVVSISAHHSIMAPTRV